MHHLREGTVNEQDEMPLLQILALAADTDGQSYRAGIPVAMQRASLPLVKRIARLRGYRAELRRLAERAQPGFGLVQGSCRRRSSSSASSATAIRDWSSVSRSRRVTVSSSIVWWSTVTPQGVPISSWRR